LPSVPICAVWDEPFYASYLAKTGLDHPMRKEILAAGDTETQIVIDKCLGAAPGGKPVFYQKHMTQHMLPDIPRDWLAEVTNVFLIRHPARVVARVVASYAAKRENPTLDDIGFRQQFELFDHVKSLGRTPIVIDSHDIRNDPKQSLIRLCKALGLPFDPAMLHWSAGGHPEDGVWAAHWYAAVHRSTGFAEAEGPLPDLQDTHALIAEQALPYYAALSASKLTG